MGSMPDGTHPFKQRRWGHEWEHDRARQCNAALRPTQGGLMHGVLSGVERWVDSETSWEQISPRRVGQADWLRFEQSMAEIFTAFGMNLDTAGTEGTPARFLRALYDATAGHEGDHSLLTAFPTECRCDSDCLVSQIIEGPIPFSAVCEHHSLPFHGGSSVPADARRIGGSLKDGDERLARRLWREPRPASRVPCRDTHRESSPVTER
jgi:hypothetical protein